MIKVLPPKTAKEVVAKERERKARTTLLMALPEDHLAKFHKMADAKEMWEAIKSRFDGNDEFKNNGNKARDNGSDNEVKSCSKTCKESYARLKQLYNEQRDKLGDASVEITAYTLSLKRLFNTQMSANDKFGLGYGDYRYGSILSYENEVLQCVFMNKKSDLEDTHVNDRYATEMHAVPPSMTGNYMPFGPDVEIDYSKFTYGLKQTSADESGSKPSKYASCESDSSVETTTSMPEPVENAPKVICEPKVWTDAPIIKEYESDSDDDSVSKVQEDKEKPSFAFTDYVKHVKTSRENVKETCTPNHSPKVEKQSKNGHTRKGLSYAFTRKTCFVCGSFSYLIRDCDFYEKRMAKQAELTKSKNKLASPKQTSPGKDNSNPLIVDSLLKTIWVLALEQSKTAQDLVIKKLQKKVKRIERKIKARTLGLTLFKIGNFRRKSLDKENVSKQGRYLKTRPMFEESDFDNIDDIVDENND
uniref:Xylulose kinase-1 n=1 Tax=Tanacetum cinerariifolium TaxID=118510 RepID=A0A6L2NB26_TANCI|nr:xylulose kinase-1 [Tanacetum cinerariifolium]